MLFANKSVVSDAEAVVAWTREVGEEHVGVCSKYLPIVVILFFKMRTSKMRQKMLEV